MKIYTKVKFFGRLLDNINVINNFGKTVFILYLWKKGNERIVKCLVEHKTIKKW